MGTSNSPSRLRDAVVIAWIVWTCATSTTLAQWSVVILHPSDASDSVAYSVLGTQQGGQATFEGAVRASLWNGSAASRLDLNPAGWDESWVTKINESEQVGTVRKIPNVQHAAAWHGTASSMVDLNPAGATQSFGLGADVGIQVGYATLNNLDRASLWSGSAASWIDLTPNGAMESYAWGARDGQEVGRVRMGSDNHASLWHGSANSWVDLNPTGALQSDAYGVDGGQQVGEARINGSVRASLWYGSADSWIDLSPVGVMQSRATDAYAGRQVGYIVLGDAAHATIWRGTSDSLLDLHNFLPDEFHQSVANGIWEDPQHIYVIGEGYDAAGRTHALMWISSVPEPSGLSVLVALAMGVGIRRKRALGVRLIQRNLRA